MGGSRTSSGDRACDFDVIVVGAGFAGLYMIHKLRQMGMSVRAYEAADDVGGVWYWNRYPGARCDVESMQYSYGFSEELQQEWNWTERFAQQPEILAYIQHVADRFELRSAIQFKTRVEAASFDEPTASWTVTTDRGDRVTAPFLVMASGSLSTARLPDICGIEDFGGRFYHTGQWPAHKIDFSGRRVGVVGTGSSGVQAIPMIAREAEHVYVFQRTPNFVIPARNRPLDDEGQRKWKDRYPEHRARAKQVGTFYEFSDRSAMDVSEDERRAEYDRRWAEGGVNFVHSFKDIYLNEESNKTAADYVRERIRSIVNDPEVAEKLCPKDHPLGTKRICVGSDYYETYNRDNVTLIDLRSEPIDRILSGGVRTAAAVYAIDTLVFATGYDALTGALTAIDIRGRDGVALKDKWEHGPQNYLGLMTAGFPNMFIITGPGSPSVLVNMIVGIEQHVEWIADCIQHLRASGFDTIEAARTAEQDWVRHVNEEADKTLFPRANSWYIGANVPGKPRVFLPYTAGIGRYRKTCEDVAAAGYRGFVLGTAPAKQGRGDHQDRRQAVA
ncbi:NAD(P)/FAD-dependent oxidoreductase [Rhizobiales bacterium L72]|uniref:NAD(P)/FAD-dependent oxidoreductase n=2 Tax=Propylenella binzhouense TaxID=2555902 RepID=A0A964T1Y4_9HYPH|nr:NAD(P)/FAD-dependent oxidoreductase [Propylenella binzhouense]MYZ46903.1 NAD(P)/FAD-dependent oxidoreductase [Propylenella binzhouense]